MDMRGHRQGTKRKDGRWQFYRKEYSEKPLYSHKGESHKQAMKRIDRMVYESMKSGTKADMKLSRVIELYLEFREGEDIAPTTLIDDKWAGGQLSEETKDMRVGGIDAFGADMILRKWDSQKCTKKKMRAFGRKLYNWIQKREWYDKNPFAMSTSVNYSPVLWGEPMTSDEFELAIQHVAGNRRELLWLLRCNGIRPTSGRELTWFELTDDGEKMYLKLKSAKTQAGKRRLRVREPAASMIRALPKTSEHVFPSTSARRDTWSANSLLNTWKDAQRKAGLKPRDVYELKDLCITELCELFDGDSLAVCLVVGLASSQVVDRNYRKIDQCRLDDKAAGMS